MSGLLRYNCASIYPLLILLLLALSPATVARPPSVYDTPVTRDLSGRPLPTRAQYLRQFPERPLDIARITPRAPHRDPRGTVVLAVNRRLLEWHNERWQIYRADLEEEGYAVVVLSVAGGSAQELKTAIIQEGGDNIVGVVFAGELPLAWFEHREHFYNENEPDNQRVVEYPIDLFFMDTDGVWEDTSGNGIYDWHHGEWEPDIWLGRMPAYNLSRIDEDSLMALYLDKVHAYRTDFFPVAHRALNFIDDDWEGWASEWSDAVRLAYGWTTEVAHPESTSAAGYVRGLEDEAGYELVQVAVHSTADSHLFLINNRGAWDYFRFRDLRERVTTRGMFYNLFACSALNPSRNLCLGALYALGGRFGLGAVGTTKTGSMLFFDDYYRRLDEGLNFGEALRQWLIDHAREPGHENWARSWFYGQTHYGDPTLRLRLGLRAREFAIDDRNRGDGDGVLDAGETAGLLLRIINRDERDFDGVTFEISTDDPMVEIFDAAGEVGAIAAGDTAEAGGLTVVVNDDTPDRHIIAFDVAIRDENDTQWRDRAKVMIRAAKLEVANVWFGAHILEPGDADTLGIGLVNIGGDDLRDGTRLVVNSLDSSFIFEENSRELVFDADLNRYLPIPSFFCRATEAYFARQNAFIRVEVQPAAMGESAPIISVSRANIPVFSEEFSETPVWFRSYAVNEGFQNVWEWREDAGVGGGGIAFGGPDTTRYPALSDGAFQLPILSQVYGYPEFVLTIQHRMDAEPEYDGGVVELLALDENDSLVWEVIEPENGYTGRAVDNGSFTGGPCWNGTFDWRNDAFFFSVHRSLDLIKIRFRFASDGGVEGAGWFIDNISISPRPYSAPTEPDVPLQFAITALYPNPFNDRLTVKYALPTASEVTIEMFDISGRMINLIARGETAAGVHQTTMDASNLPAGVYLMKLTAGEFRDIRKVVLMP